MSVQHPVIVGAIGAPFGVHGWVRVKSFTAPATNLLDYRPWYIRPSSTTPHQADNALAWRASGAAQHAPGNRIAAAGGRNGVWLAVGAEAKPHQNGFVARIDGCTDRDEAAAWRGATIGVPRNALPEIDPDEYYWRDLVGCRVVGEDGDLGEVVRVMPTPAHDVLVVAKMRSGGESGSAPQHELSAGDGVELRLSTECASEPDPNRTTRTYLIPFVRQIVTTVAVDRRLVVASWQTAWIGTP